MSRAKKYAGHKVAVTFAPSRCIHAAECVKGHPGVFDANRKPWVDPDAGTVEEIARVINRCPSGALHFETDNRELYEVPDEKALVDVSAGGPLFLRGDITVSNADGEVILKDTRVALCRCGASENKPYCDGSHTKAGFADACLIATDKGQADEMDGSAVEITCAANGPLLLTGSFTIRSGDSFAFREKAALCRCGGSAEKPFCDGSHKKLGFEG